MTSPDHSEIEREVREAVVTQAAILDVIHALELVRDGELADYSQETYQAVHRAETLLKTLSTRPASHERAEVVEAPSWADGFAACPTCKQYSQSIRADKLAEAFNHFQTMFSHRGDGIPTQFCFDEKTRDAAQVLVAAARALTPPIQKGVSEELCPKDGRPCFVSRESDDAHWRCGTSACKALSADPVVEAEMCDQCGGAGVVGPDQTCPSCNGSGAMWVSSGHPKLNPVVDEARAAALEEAAVAAESMPEQILHFWDRPGGPPGNGYRPTKPADIAATIRALKDPSQ